MNIIGCLDVPTRGKYYLNGVDVSTMKDDEQAEVRNKMLGFIFQQYNLLPRLNVRENVELSLLYAGVPAGERHRRAMKALERVGLADKAKNMPNQLSGGQQQRVSIARALAGDPSVILADEPTGALDSHTSHEVLAFLQELNREGNTIVLITHDNSIAACAQRIVRLQDGRIIYDGPVDGEHAMVQPDEPIGTLTAAPTPAPRESETLAQTSDSQGTPLFGDFCPYPRITGGQMEARA
jgi:putative ABC transport system ATP-binding protein